VRTYTSPPGAEILGQNIRAWAENLQGSDTAPIMKKYGLVDVNPNGWYPLESLMNAMNDLVKNPKTVSSLVAIGMEIGRIVPLPPELTLGQVLMGWNDVYQSLHRKGDVGAIHTEKINDKHYRITFTDVYPDDFSYGIMYGYARRLLPLGTYFKVFYDPDVKPRDLGGQGKTIIHLEWE
jgi:hypothetical protein